MSDEKEPQAQGGDVSDDGVGSVGAEDAPSSSVAVSLEDEMYALPATRSTVARSSGFNEAYFYQYMDDVIDER